MIQWDVMELNPYTSQDVPDDELDVESNLSADLESADDRYGIAIDAGGCFFLGLLAFAALTTIALLLGRSDTSDEMVESHFFAAIVVAPLWALIAFIVVRRRDRDLDVRTLRPMVWAVATYAAIASLLIVVNVVMDSARNSNLPKATRGGSTRAPGESR